MLASIQIVYTTMFSIFGSFLHHFPHALVLHMHFIMTWERSARGALSISFAQRGGHGETMGGLRKGQSLVLFCKHLQGTGAFFV